MKETNVQNKREKNKNTYNYERDKCPELRALRTLCFQTHCLIALGESCKDLILYKDVNELTNLCFKLSNVCRITFEDFNTRL